MNVKIKKLNENAVIPSYAKPGDAGMDLTSISYEYDENADNHIYGTGIALEIPKGYVGLIFPRSSNRKTNSYLTNHVGVIDSGYRGEIMFTFKNRDSKMLAIPEKPYKVGDRIGQIIILPYPEINFIETAELNDSERGENGHGSTGN
jgi:dUTP pyrophosphatase